MGIVVIGSSNVDLVIQAPRLPEPGETVLSRDSYRKLRGGKGANQAVAARRLGGEVAFVGRVGADPFGEFALQGLIEEGVDVSRLRVDKNAQTGLAEIIVGADGANMIAVAEGANGAVSKGDVDDAMEIVSSSSLCVLQQEVPEEAVSYALREAKRIGARTILDPAPARPLGEDVWKTIDILTPNVSEARILTGIDARDEASADRASSELFARGVGAVVLTMGGLGAYVKSPLFTGLVPACKALVVDTTAAGDAFNGALAVALSEGKSLERATRFAVAAGALAVEKIGAQSSLPRREEVESLVLGGRL